MKRLACVFVAMGVSLGTAGARADIAPTPDMCGPVGSVCSNGGPKRDEPGVCTSGVSTSPTTCGPGTPSAPAQACLYCAPNSDKDAGSSEAGASNGGTNAPAKSDGGCAIGRIGTERNVAVLLLSLGAVALAFGRRRADSSR